MMTPGGNKKTTERKLNDLEDEQKKNSWKLSGSKMQSTMFVGLFMIIFMSFLSNTFSGVVVAKLPFEPFSLIRGLTHRNLPGNDYTECSMIFIYILSNVTFRPLIQKLLGFEPPRGVQANSMFPNMPKKKAN